MGPTEYLSVVRARYWAIVALVVIGVSVAWTTTPSKPAAESEAACFRATTSLVTGPSAPTDGSINLSLVASLAASSVVIERSAAELGRPSSELLTELEISVNEKAGTLLISSIDADPALAAMEADTIAAQLLAFLIERRQQQLEPLIAATNERTATIENRIRTLDTQPAILGTPEADLQRAERDSAVRQLSANYDRLQQLTAQVASAANELAIVSPATATPEIRSDGFSTPNSRSARSAIGLIVGLFAGLALVLLFERMNPKVRTTAQAEQVFGLPVIAEIPRQSRLSRWRGGIATFSDPHSVAAESYRGLRTALTYMPRTNGDEPDIADRFATGHVVLVTSAASGEGKSTVVANLAAGFAEKDSDVIVVSGDARQPAIETLLLGRRTAGARLVSKDPCVAVATMIPRVKLVLSCDPELNPADIVNYEREIVQQARSGSQIVIVDTPPALIANDATELMHTADSIVLVARCGTTSVASARRTAELIARLRVAVVGVVLVGGSETGDAAGSNYFRRRPRRPQRRERPLRLPDAKVLPHEPAASRVLAPGPVDDGGIWRPKTVIDLSHADDHPVRWPQTPPREAPRPPRAIVGDGYPSRDTLDPNRGEAAGQLEVDRAGLGAREKLPLFRAGDGNGRSRDQ